MQKSIFLNNLHNLMEANRDTLANSRHVDEKRLARSKNIPDPTLSEIQQDASGNAVLHYAVNSETKPDVKYDCYVDIIPKGNSTLFTLAHGKMSTQAKYDLIRNADVKCFCSCPDFPFSGMMYNMMHKYKSLATGYKSVNGIQYVDKPPKKRDPKKQRTVCKHLLRVFASMSTHTMPIMKMIRETPVKLTEKEQADVDEILAKINTPEEEITPKAKDRHDSLLNDKETTNKPSEPINMLSEANAVSLPESKDALTALAGTIAKPDISEESTPASSDESNTASRLLNAEENDTEEEKTSGLLEKPDVEDSTPNNLADIQSESKLAIFDVPADEDTDPDA